MLLLVMDQALLSRSGVNFQNIIGLEQAKKLLKEAVLMPLKYPHFF